MSPLLLRRYRADRLLREQFESLRERVLGAVAARMRAAGRLVDRGDLEAAYAQAWQGLHAVVLDGQLVENPAGWLVVVTHRRALDEHRARRAAREAPFEELALQETSLVGASSRHEHDIAGEVDDRTRLRTLIGAWRLGLNERERQAAALCYLQGLSRAEAAAQMGVSPARMRKLMDGGRGLRGVAAKVGALAQAIAAGDWCQQQGSLMRGLAFGILDPQGERYRLALAHSDECPACRSYVLSLRGLAAALPPLPILLQWASAGTAIGAGGLAGTTSVTAGSGSVSAAPSAAAPAAGLSAGALPSCGVAGAGALGGGWWLAGGLGAKLAMGCLLALGVGAGCLALDGSFDRRAVTGGAHRHGSLRRGSQHAAGSPLSASARTSRGIGRLAPDVTAVAAGHDPLSAPASAARREFGPEAGLGGAAEQADRAGARAAAARASARAAQAQASGEPGGAAPVAVARAASHPSSQTASAPAAAREFGPG